MIDADTAVQIAKDNPAIEKGMLVAVYHHRAGRPLDGYGMIVSTFWSQFYAQYCCNVRMQDGTERHGILACNLERISFGGSTQAALLTARTVQGGRK